MKILILGAPGVGKGTYSRGLSEALNFPVVSTGDILRSLRDDSPEGKVIRSYYEKGLPVPDEIVMPIIKERLSKDDCKENAILDGNVTYNIKQAEMLDEMLILDLVINLTMPDSIVIKKNLGRRTCRNCWSVFNVAEINEKGIHLPPLPPKKENVCDKCGGPLYIRTDDTEEVMRTRLKLYYDRIKPVLKFYRSKGIVRDFKVTSSPNVTLPLLLKLVRGELEGRHS